MPATDATHPLRAQLHTLARYHAWATARLLDAVDALPDEAYRRDAGLFFRSVHGTLNHLLVAEQGIWWARFVEGASPVLALDAELEPDRTRLRERVLAGAHAWAATIDGWPDEHLAGTLHYRKLSGAPVALPFAATLAHVFNHATHHRGQITAALTAAGHAAPELDLVYLLQQEAAAATTPP
jgi:uncharacterized damage-inducible protein DinB